MISSLFKKKQILCVPQSLLLKRLKLVAKQHNLFIYENITFYHNDKEYLLPLLLIDEKRGIYLFEYKNWSYDELKLSKIKKATNTIQAENTLAYDKIHNIILEKLSLFSNHKKLSIFNFLLMENLNIQEYHHLNDTFKTLLPEKNILFSNSQDKEIISKLQSVSKQKKNLTKVANIISSIAFQYAIVDNSLKPRLTTKEQNNFIHTKIDTQVTLSGTISSGKSSTLLTKALFEHIKDKQKKIILILKTNFATSIMKEKLNFIAKDTTLKIDTTKLEIITPLELVNKHLKRLNLPLAVSIVNLEEKLFTTTLNIADIILCDDIEFLDKEFIQYLLHIQKNKPLILVSLYNKTTEQTFFFETSFRIRKKRKEFLQTTDSCDKVVTIVKDLLNTCDKEDILVVSHPFTQSFLYEDLQNIAKIPTLLLDAKQTYKKEQLQSNIILSTYYDFYGINTKYVILLDICSAPYYELAYLFYLAQEKTFILYEEECDISISLQKNLNKGLQ